MGHRTLIRGSTLLAVAATMAIVMGASPSIATDSNCSDGTTCLFEHSGLGETGNGCKFVRDQGDASFLNNSPSHEGCSSLGGDGFNDDASAAKNKDNYAKTLCGDIDFKGGISANLSANTNYVQLPNNDTASSMYNGVSNCN